MPDGNLNNNAHFGNYFALSRFEINNAGSGTIVGIGGYRPCVIELEGSQVGAIYLSEQRG
jgi:hypothetical protein